MPKVVSYTPPWLQRGHPGYDLFAKAAPSSKNASGPQRTIATRDSEVFVAVGKEIRWADLAKLKESYEANNDNLSSSRSRRLASPSDNATYRTLKISVPLPIKRLAVSPLGDYLAVSTSHTVHIVILPDSSLLDAGDDSPIKPKTFQVGPTAHVLEESPVASLLWHPLGYHGHCLVTITVAGVLRLWELHRSDRSSFSEPTLSIDLTKLANATSDKVDLSASRLGASKGFSPDSVELEVAAACFGDFPESQGVHGWAPMTLWVAMVEGDLYALCPLLPSKWQLPNNDDQESVLQTLATSIQCNLADLEDDSKATPEERDTASKQLSWWSDIQYQEPFREHTTLGDPVDVFIRPDNVSAYPLLQGPFSLSPELDEFELTDIIVYSLKTFSDGTEDEPAEGLPAAAICLLTDTARVHVCLDLEGVVGRWLPSETDGFTGAEAPEHILIVAETLLLANDQESSYNQTITQDVHKDFSFFVSHGSGIYYVSLESWITALEAELSVPSNEGIDFRLERLLGSTSTKVERCLEAPGQSKNREQVTSCVVIEDGNVGYLLLTTYDSEPSAVILDAPDNDFPSEQDLAQEYANEGMPVEMRPSYQPPKEFWEHSQLLRVINDKISSRQRASLKEELRLSPANLLLLVEAHKVLSQETQHLQTAVADLFRRCERLRDEFQDQIYRTAQLATKIDNATGNDEDPSDSSSETGGNAKFEERIDKVKSRQAELNARYESLRRRMANVGGPELSEKEAGWMDELSTMERSLDKKAQTLTDDVDGSERPAWQRLEQVASSKREVVKEVEAASCLNSQERASRGVKVPSQSRKQESEQIDVLLQRETALVEAATDRLRNLGISIPLGVTEG
ncbi:hypothetical protein BDV96DRAFT_613440 [Lophiotrema nucula]|uniref:Nuclear pore complex protein An-Nup82 n=1 Tax=Lophiotrema nucula TaxID=690887 RepID=A0A6A5Z5U7_9PLEO|nr:hypothetical protein BDV96DRAFT_613440 [Lophiotrema nucula]